MIFTNGFTSSKSSSSQSEKCDFSGWAIIEYILICHILWWTSYWTLLLLSKQSEEWCCRLLTFVHGCIVSVLAISDILLNKGDFYGVPLTVYQEKYLCFTLSYFIFDFLWIHFFGNEPWVIYYHHVTSILTIIKLLMSDSGGLCIAYVVAGLEFTNPYLQLRWFLRTYGFLNTPIHTIVELWFFFAFFLIRVLGGTVMFVFVEFYSQTGLLLKIAFLSIYIVSLLLSWQIFIYLRKKYWTTINSRSTAFITSKISISPYFQRRTRDSFGSRSQSNYNISAQEIEPASSPVG